MTRNRTEMGSKVGLLFSFWLVVSCRTPCVGGFERGKDGVCHASNPCEPGEARGEDLLCHPRIVPGEDTAVSPDSGEPVVDTGSGGGDSGGPVDGPGRIQVRYPALSGYPAHGFIVFAQPEDAGGPTAAFCQIILAAEVDVSGYLEAYDGEADPCPSFGEALVFESGPVQLSMVVARGAEEEPALCDERTVHIMGDITVDYSGVTTCTE